uniref:DUF300-domain-containing protein n=1 Tax=Ulva partita TaxID=1605170 RepID=A0A1C9ZPW6_9CHLO|nr:DUF300-domain-containing protein [Ulva partita]BAV58343.1 DUF300-domain-containing protein [Ulva partita]
MRFLLESQDTEQHVNQIWTSTSSGLAGAGVCAFAATVVSGVQIILHATNYEDPTVQKFYIRIIFLIPNYAISSFFSLIFSAYGLYIETVRDMYEAFVIYSFMSLLLEYIGGPGHVEAVARDEIVTGSCLYGTCCFPAMQVDGQFVKLCKRLVLQFVILKPLIVLLTLVLYSQGSYHDGRWSFGGWYMYLQIVYNFCYAAALLGLIHFWAGTKDMLKPYKPVWKFVTIKAVVFSTFWQGFLISLLLRNELADGRSLQTWILCIEMLPAACAMWFAFPATQYIRAARSRQEGGFMMAVQNVGRVAIFTDVVTDLHHQFKPQYNTYTCYKDMEAELQDAQPSGMFRHATYIMKDPYQQHAISEKKRVAGKHEV